MTEAAGPDCGPFPLAVGSGHYTKMIHNGIEYGLMQAYAEGWSILQHKSEFELDLRQITEIWRYGRVVHSAKTRRCMGSRVAASRRTSRPCGC